MMVIAPPAQGDGKFMSSGLNGLDTSFTVWTISPQKRGQGNLDDGKAHQDFQKGHKEAGIVGLDKEQ